NPPKAGITLRDAIIAASNSGFGSEIKINLSAGSVIKPTKELPAVGNDVFIDAVDTDGNPNPTFLDGSLAGKSNGLVFAGSNSGVNGLDIGNFKKAGVLITGTNDYVTTCQIGANLDGKLSPNGLGVYVFKTTGADLEANTIPGNLGPGIQVEES